MKKIQIIISVSVLIIIAASVIYAQLGGAKDIEIKKTSTNGYSLIGKKYEGKRSSKAFGKLMNEVADLVKTNQIKGNFAVYHFINPDSEQDTLNSLVGIMVADSMQAVPEDYVFIKFASQEVLQATLKSHWLVSPSPAEVTQKLQAYALTNRLTLVDTILEKYNQDKEIITEITIKSK
jgi:hypothetical protein